MPVLTAIDVLGIQRFIFCSNRLQDVVTGSYLVHWSTSKDNALKNLVSEKNILLAGGGNAVIEFDSLDKARKFTSEYTRRLYDTAPGIEVAVCHKEFSPGTLAKSLLEIQIDMIKIKSERDPSSPLLGISVTTPCQETGLPATDYDTKNNISVPVSKEIRKRRDQKNNVERHWFNYLKNNHDFAFPLELDQLGRTMGDTSLIGIVHVDGNGVGKKITEWLGNKSTQDAKVRQEYHEWSTAIDNLGKKTLAAVIDRVLQNIGINDSKKYEIRGNPESLCFELKKVGKWMLPIRPILLGGDDLTFVCDARLALDLAETALDVFSRSDIPHLGKIYACAGISMIRVHTPFSRAYAMAEQLCASAKHKLTEENKEGCALDWHIGITRPGETVPSIRRRQYHVNPQPEQEHHENIWKLTCRPYMLGNERNDLETWRWLSRSLLDDETIGLRGEIWQERRNKVKALREMVMEGPESLQAGLKSWRVVDNRLSFPPPIQVDGFFEKTRTPLLDAIELMDIHLSMGDEFDMPGKETEQK